MGQALYRKYRSKSLAEIVGQEHITETLDKAIKSGRISHAYLFTGPRGVGKTSIARILAHEINGLAYTDDSSHLDIIEIDAASNRRIDEIRDLRDKVHITPAQAKYKVYIIDEVHMLTREAFNALLKTLEEPPAHAIFILATTEAHKLPETIVSRTQRFTFKPVETQKVAQHLKDIASKEAIDIDDAALEFLAKAGEGSFRDSISLLDQMSGSGKKVRLPDVQSMLGIPPSQTISQLLDELATGTSASQIITALTNLYDQGYQAGQIAHEMVRQLRQQLVDGKSRLESAAILSLMNKLIETSSSHSPERYIEICLLSLSQTVASPTVNQPIATSAPKPTAKAVSAQPIKKTTTSAAPNITQKVIAPTGPLPKDISFWPQVLDTVKKQYSTLYSVLKTTQPVLTETGLEIRCEYAFHQKRIKESKNIRVLSDIISEITQSPISIECVVQKREKTPAAAAKSGPPSEEPALSSISNIFGGGELLES